MKQGLNKNLEDVKATFRAEFPKCYLYTAVAMAADTVSNQGKIDQAEKIRRVD
jgi:hypothetical protein